MLGAARPTTSVSASDSCCSGMTGLGFGTGTSSIAAPMYDACSPWSTNQVSRSAVSCSHAVGLRRAGKIAAHWRVTVEFEAKDHPAPIHLEVVIPVPQLLYSDPKPLVNMDAGQRVPVHYLKKWPALAVIDSLVK